MIKNIVFDVGNVLMAYDANAYMKRLGFDEDTRDAVNQAMFQNPLWDETDRGVLSDRQLEEGFVKNAPAQYESAVRLAYQRASETISLLPYSAAWVKEMKARGYRLYILSNYSRKIYRETESLMEFLPYMDGALFSYQCHLIKPQPQIYRHLCDTFGLVPGETVFLDDREENVQGAVREGIHAIRFTGYEQTRRRLDQFLEVSDSHREIR